MNVLVEARPHLARVRRVFVEHHQCPGRGQRLAELLRLLENGGCDDVLEATCLVRRTFDRDPTTATLLFTVNIYADRPAASA